MQRLMRPNEGRGLLFLKSFLKKLKQLTKASSDGFSLMTTMNLGGHNDYQ